jgi:hypothetical protein
MPRPLPASGMSMAYGKTARTTRVRLISPQHGESPFGNQHVRVRAGAAAREVLGVFDGCFDVIVDAGRYEEPSGPRS